MRVYKILSGTSSTQASNQTQDFQQNPADYIQRKAIDTSALNAAGQGYFTLKGKSAASQLGTTSLADYALKAYWCPYRSGTDLPGHIEVPREPTSPQHRFILTPSMNGCAFVVTSSPQGAGYFRLYHHQHPGDNPEQVRQKIYAGEAKPDNVPNGVWNTWKAIYDQGQTYISMLTFDDYYITNLTPKEAQGGNMPLAFNFLYHDGNQWYYVFQPDIRNVNGKVTLSRNRLKDPPTKPVFTVTT